MNDSALQSPPMTVPATDRADSAPAPLPAAPPALRPKLVVLRGLRIDVEYPIYEGRNTVGRFADKPVDIDLMNQESVEQIWCSRQHAVVTCDAGVVAVEDLNSLNGTWVNGVRIHPGQRRLLKPGDILQIGTVQMKLVLI
jgi:pSer/pThr/pTyr-binding forkhead associated (FHA) protein